MFGYGGYIKMNDKEKLAKTIIEKLKKLESYRLEKEQQGVTPAVPHAQK